MKTWQACYRRNNDSGDEMNGSDWIYVMATRPKLAAEKAALKVIPEAVMYGYVAVRECRDLAKYADGVIRKYWVRLDRHLKRVIKV